MIKTIHGELLPHETIQCQNCDNTVAFGVVCCPNCGVGISYERVHTPQKIIWNCATFFAFPLTSVALWFPELGQIFGWPIVAAVLLALGGMFAKWGFNRMWPRRNEVKAQFYRRTHLGYSTKTLNDEYAENMKPLLAMFAVPFGLAVVFGSNWAAHFILGLFDADTGDLAVRLSFIISFLVISGSTILAIRLELPAKLRRKNRFFA